MNLLKPLDILGSTVINAVKKEKKTTRTYILLNLKNVMKTRDFCGSIKRLIYIPASEII